MTINSLQSANSVHSAVELFESLVSILSEAERLGQSLDWVAGQIEWPTLDGPDQDQIRSEVGAALRRWGWRAASS